VLQNPVPLPEERDRFGGVHKRIGINIGHSGGNLLKPWRLRV
jgi:hypothetical protein